MLIEPMNLLRENENLKELGVLDAMERIFIDEVTFIFKTYEIVKA